MKATTVATIPQATSGKNAVKVENISEGVSGQDVVALFSKLIGDVYTSQLLQDNVGSHIEIVFYTPDAAKKALCMSGYAIGGKRLLVSLSVALKPPRIVSHKKDVDNRRNLYVLGLPFALTTFEFTSTFSRYGVVSHCVILATVDNASRRRGFVVMSTHEEAQLAMESLSEINGHALDISWAVVQRSKGFLDGGDRTLDSRSLSGNSPDNQPISLYSPLADSDCSNVSRDQSLTSFTASPGPTSTILVANIPTLLFSQEQDLYPLLCPFGRIMKLQMLDVPVADIHAHVSVVVEYASVLDATDAAGTLQGQSYAGHTVDVSYLQSNSPPPIAPFASHPENLPQRGCQTTCSSYNSDLNVFAPPFIFEAPHHPTQLLLLPANSGQSPATTSYFRNGMPLSPDFVNHTQHAYGVRHASCSEEWNPPILASGTVSAALQRSTVPTYILPRQYVFLNPLHFHPNIAPSYANMCS